MHSLIDILLSLPLYSWVALVISALGIATMCMRTLQTGEARARSAERKRRKELRLLADKISGYGQSVHKRYPAGDVVVSERDLAEQLRRPRTAVATALNLLLSEQRVQRAPLKGYWKINV
jgi:heme exporter protein D